jgi:hypothetical protein
MLDLGIVNVLLGVNEDVAGDGVEERGQEALVEPTEPAAMLGMLGLC